MDRAKAVAKKKYEDQGWDVYDIGFPDLIMTRTIGDKRELATREVKLNGDTPSKEQVAILQLFNSFGIDSSVVYVDENFIPTEAAQEEERLSTRTGNDSIHGPKLRHIHSKNKIDRATSRFKLQEPPYDLTYPKADYATRPEVLAKAGLTENEKTGIIEFTSKGLELLAKDRESKSL